MPSRIEMDDDEDDFADLLDGSNNSTRSNSKGPPRTNGYDSERNSPSPEPESSRVDRFHSPRANLNEDGEDEDEVGPGEFSPGAIVRVKLTNFVTYESAEFFPGPNLNMVIGPNGTGKSSLVCAICLGLGWGPQHLGRASQVGEFVKHGMSDAFVEIELQGPKGKRNHVVRLRIIRDGNGRDFWLDGKKTSLKNVQSLMKELSIQVDNLCQFLPQDKVSEFAALSPVDLLLHTQRAAAPAHMVEWHDSLKNLRKEQKALDTQKEVDAENLQRLETRQQNLHAEVQRLQERIQVQEKVGLLKNTIPFVEYKIAREQHDEYRRKKLDAQHRLKELETRIAPTLQSITEKEMYRGQINVVVNERKKAVKTAEGEADGQSRAIDALTEEISKNEQEVQAEVDSRKNRQRDIEKFQRKITDMKARLNDPPIEFNATEWNERTRAKEHEVRVLNEEINELRARDKEMSDTAKSIRQNKETALQELAAFDTQEGKQLNKLEQVSKDTANAWKWVQANRDKFEHEVYGPPMISCSVKDGRYTNVLESFLKKNDFLAITAQSLADMKKLSNQFYKVMKLGEVTVRTSEERLPQDPPILSRQQMQQFGLDGWALEFIDGPEPVLAMLNGSGRLQRSAVAMQDNSEAQYDMIIEDGSLVSWAAGKQLYQISRRREYGPDAQTTITKSVNAAKYWTDQPVDTSASREIQQRIDELDAEFNELKQQVLPIREERDEKISKRKEIEGEIVDMKNKKADLQKAKNEQESLPGRIEREEEALQDRLEFITVSRNKVKKLATQHDHATLRKAKLALEYRNLVAKIRACHEDLLEAQIRFIEADSDVAALTERNQDIVRQLAEEKQKVKDAEEDSKIVKQKAQRALSVVKEILANPDNEPYTEQFQNFPPGTTVESLEMEIAAEESKLEFIHANNPNAIRDFEQRQLEVEALQGKIANNDEKLENISRRITKIRSKWEPELDKLIATISDAFSYNFEQIGCAGEVGVHKDDDFENWAIQIKVKFRENETLQLLDQHRQSGGERSVSTIFFLMSLQSLARAPFRVVDEINQGMDPRNERMVHERMVEIACKEHTSQYFLITPKLLTGLRYDKRMKVLCIASGEFMPENYKELDVSKIIGIRRAIMAA